MVKVKNKKYLQEMFMVINNKWRRIVVVQIEDQPQKKELMY